MMHTCAALAYVTLVSITIPTYFVSTTKLPLLAIDASCFLSPCFQHSNTAVESSLYSMLSSTHILAVKGNLNKLVVLAG